MTSAVDGGQDPVAPDPVLALVDAQPMPAIVDRVVLGADGAVVDMLVEHVNASARELFAPLMPHGWQPGRSIFDLVPSIAPGFWDFHVTQGNWRTSTSGSLDLPGGPDGDRRVEFHQAPLPPDRLVAFFIDRTHEDELRREAERARTRLGEVLRAIPEGLIVVRMEGDGTPEDSRLVLELSSQSARQTFPYLQDGAEIPPGAERASLVAEALSVRPGDPPVRGRRVLPAPAGAITVDYSLVRPEPDVFVVVFREVDEQLRLEQQAQQAALMASRARRLLYVALDSAPNAFSVLKVHRGATAEVVGLSYEFLNEAACPPGLEVRDVVGQNVLQAHPEFDDLGVYEEMVRAADDPAPRRLTLEVAQRGEQAYRELILSRVDEDRLVVSEFDVTPLRRTQQQLRAARDEALAASQAKSDFLATITHELRTPLTTILGATDLLLDTPLEEEQQTLVRRQRDGAEVLLALVQDILDLSKIEAGQLELEAVRLELRGLVGRSVGMVQQRASAKGLTLDWAVADDLPDRMVGDPVRLQQILLNLLSNAVKFTESGGIEVAVRRAGEQPSRPDRARLVFSVRDTGIGLSAEVAGRLFQPFVQADVSTTRRYGGSGLGLSIARRLVEHMSGEMGVDSEEGRGSVFWFTAVLGVAEDEPVEPDPATAAASEQPAWGGWQPLVLLAEDNDVNRLLVTAILTKAGCRVDQAANGVEAVAAVQDQHYDLVLMDVRMPEMDGLEATRRIREHERAGAARSTILALTANATSDALRDTEQAGMDGFLSKPINRPALEGALRLWCRPPRAPTGSVGS